MGLQNDPYFDWKRPFEGNKKGTSMASTFVFWAVYNDMKHLFFRLGDLQGPSLHVHASFNKQGWNVSPIDFYVNWTNWTLWRSLWRLQSLKLTAICRSKSWNLIFLVLSWHVVKVFLFFFFFWGGGRDKRNKLQNDQHGHMAILLSWCWGISLLKGCV